MRWDLFCHVVDNWGDIGICWRLAADLAGRGEQVRLWADDPAPLGWMAPHGAPGVEVVHWRDGAPDVAPHEVVVEAFGCSPPAGFVARMATQARPPVWINLEYLSAERFVEDSHRLPSPLQAGPGRGLTKWFFFPGFSDASGGLIRERGLIEQRAAFDRDAWLAALGWPRRADESVVVLFCYDNARLPALLESLTTEPTLLLVTSGLATAQVAPLLAARPWPATLRTVLLPLLEQTEFDRLLWSADVNFVRGEDSLVRALWAGAPFVWQAYPQHDGVHERKLHALLSRLLADADAPTADAVRRLWQQWNGFDGGVLALPPAEAWRAQVLRWRESITRQADLATQLLGFAAERR